MYEVLLPAELAGHAASGTLSGQFDFYDTQDADNARIASEISLPDDGTNTQLEQAGMQAMLEKRREQRALQPILLERPLAASMPQKQADDVRRVLHHGTSLAYWSVDTDVPPDLLALLAGLVQTKVFGTIEVWQTPKGVDSSDGLLFVGKEPNQRYCQPGSDKTYYPIARWTTQEGLTSFSKMCRRGRYGPDWLVPFLFALGTVCITLANVVHMFAAPDMTAWWAEFGWQLTVGCLGTISGVYWLANQLDNRTKRGMPSPDWLNKVEIPAVVCYFVAWLGLIASIVTWVVAM